LKLITEWKLLEQFSFLPACTYVCMYVGTSAADRVTRFGRIFASNREFSLESFWKGKTESTFLGRFFKKIRTFTKKRFGLRFGLFFAKAFGHTGREA
jgi:hypothetical protein